MFHEDLQADIISEDWSPVTASPPLVIVGLAGVHLAQQEPGLATTLLCVNVPGKEMV